jgi:hypothetical protein
MLYAPGPFCFFNVHDDQKEHRESITGADDYFRAGLEILRGRPAVSSYGTEEDHRRKRFEGLRARCMLAGITLVESRDERGVVDFIVSRWALTRALPSLDAVEAWLKTVTGGRY